MYLFGNLAKKEDSGGRYRQPVRHTKVRCWIVPWIDAMSCHLTLLGALWIKSDNFLMMRSLFSSGMVTVRMARSQLNLM